MVHLHWASVGYSMQAMVSKTYAFELGGYCRGGNEYNLSMTYSVQASSKMDKQCVSFCCPGLVELLLFNDSHITLSGSW